MGMVQVLVERQGRWCVWRMVLVWLACLCRRSVVSCWRRFPLVPWRLSFSSRMLLPIIDGPPQDRIAKHQDSAYGKLETAKRLLHGQLNAGTGGGARRERGGDGRTNAPWACASRWSSWDSRCGCDGDNEMEEGRWDGGWCGAACALSRSHTNGWQVSVCLVRLRQLCPGAAPGVMQTRDEVRWRGCDRLRASRYVSHEAAERDEDVWHGRITRGDLHRDSAPLLGMPLNKAPEPHLS